MQSLHDLGDYILFTVMFIFGAFFMLMFAIFHAMVLTILLLIATIDYFDNKTRGYYHILKGRLRNILNSVLGSRIK